MRKGKLFILQQDVSSQQKTKKVLKKSLVKTKKPKVNAAYYDSFEAIDLQFSTVEPAPNHSPNSHEETTEVFTSSVIESFGIADEFQDFENNTSDESLENFFHENSSTTPDSKPTEPFTPKQPEINSYKENLKSSSSLNSIPIDSNSPHHIFDQIGQQMNKAKVISLGDFSIEKSFDHFDKEEEILSDEELNKDFDQIKLRKKN